MPTDIRVPSWHATPCSCAHLLTLQVLCRMESFDDQIARDRVFDNVQFVNFTELGRRAQARSYSAAKWEADFALSSLMEIPDQYAAICKLGLLGKQQFDRPAQEIRVTPLQGGASGGAYAGAPVNGGAPPPMQQWPPPAPPQAPTC